MTQRPVRAFVLVELLALAAVAGVLVALLIVGSSDTRRQARLGDCTANMRGIGDAAAAYGADYAERVWSFSWRKGVNCLAVPGGGCQPVVATSDSTAGAYQALDILRRRAGRYDIQQISSWVPHFSYSHLVLADYQSRELPDPTSVCPEDQPRLCWSSDPLAFDRCECVPFPGPPATCGTNGGKRWPYSSSYQLPPSWFSADNAQGVVNTISQAGSHNTFMVPSNAPLGRRLLSEVQFPSNKVMLYDTQARHFGPRTAFFAYAEARQPLLFADGAVSVRVAGDANPGGQPNIPSSPNHTIINYFPTPAPHDWESPPLNGQPSESGLLGRFRFTRGGLRGRDFGGPEIPY